MMCPWPGAAWQAGGGQPDTRLLLLLAAMAAARSRRALRVGKGRTMTPRLPHAAAMQGLAGAAGQPAASAPQQQEAVSPSLGPMVQQLLLRPRAGASGLPRRQQQLGLTVVSRSAIRARQQQQQEATPRPASLGHASQHSDRTSGATKVSVCGQELLRHAQRSTCVCVCEPAGQHNARLSVSAKAATWGLTRSH